MPWSNQNGGGPWGGGGGNNNGNNQGGPWGQGPNKPRGGGGGGNGGGNGGPPDLEDLIRRSQDRLRSVMPGGFNGGVFAILALVIVAFVVFQSFYTVQPNERAVELRFGVPKQEVSGQGLHFHFWPIETVEIVQITEQQQTIGARSTTNSNAGWMLTGDTNIVNVQFSVLYTITDPVAYLFKLETPSETLSQVADSAMREVVGRRPAQDIFRDDRAGISVQVLNIIQDTLNRYGAGITINAVPIEDASPPREVADAFEEVQRAEQDEDRLVEEANRYANQKLGGARGQAAQVREEAAAYRDRVVNEATGEAQRFISIYDQYKNAPEVTRQRIFLETMEGVLKNSNKVIIEDGKGVVPYLPINELMKQPAGAAAATQQQGAN
ncbi:FtsH protease activity modulator HflK [Rhizobiales bacterium RZME27]|uniref:Protein HflK n=1 Tax=Endobacterium cereale TaxID=2663029 RepID=A0A6A8A924_9HYPH|nr:FtsH protease activity modulator HflK [Endobacterium cereale]MEB2843281.1 FtsH protease activity modulator HflK [Endobacterium cereale]MQY47239.1 FtsH protease activity modulator HflK [Endobacterium cereale]